MIKLGVSSNTLIAAAAVLGGAGVAPAQGDVTLTIQQAAATSGASQSPVAPRSMTLSFRGDEARMEIAGGPVLLYDGKEGIIETLHPAEKTYDMTFTTQVFQAGDPLANLAVGQVTADTHLDLQKTDQTMMLAGVAARKYLVVGSISYARPQGGSYGGRGGGGRRHGGGGGGFPMMRAGGLDQNGGGWNGGGGGDRRQAPLPQYSIGGELWLSDAVKLPSDKNATAFPAAELAAAGAGPFLQPLTDALNSKKELPLLTRITVTRTLPATNGATVDAYGGVMEGEGSGASGPATTTTVTTMTVTAISTGPVDPNAFEAPSAFALVPAPVEVFDPRMPPVPPAAAAP